MFFRTGANPTNDVLLVNVPPIPPDDGIDRSHFIPVMVHLSPPSGITVSTAFVEFGYLENGAPEDHACTSRREACVSVSTVISDTNPFYYKSTDQYHPVPCSGGCDIAVPLIPGRVAYVKSNYLDNNGAVVATGLDVATEHGAALMAGSLPVVAPATTLTMSPQGGVFTGPVDITLSTSTSGVTIYYTLDGSVPTANSTPYTTPIHLTQSALVRAIGIKSGSASASAENSFTIQSGVGAGRIAPLVVSPAGGTFTGPVDVTISTATAGAAIYYTLDGTTPGTGSPLYVGTIHLNSSGWIRATAAKSRYSPPDTVEYQYSISASATTPPPPPPPAPVITPNGGTFSNCPNVAISTSVAGATIRYTLDGTPPAAASPVYIQPIRLPGSVVVSARAFAGDIGGAVSQAAFIAECGMSVPR